MSKKRGLSLEEKQDQMLEVFFDSQTFFQLKDLEKLGPKKGVICQLVKDVVQSVVNDYLVFNDKIGTSLEASACKTGERSCGLEKAERQAALSGLNAMEKKHKEFQMHMHMAWTSCLWKTTCSLYRFF